MLRDTSPVPYRYPWKICSSSFENCPKVRNTSLIAGATTVSTRIVRWNFSANTAGAHDGYWKGFPNGKPPACLWSKHMIFRPYYYFETGCAAYVFGCGTLGKCAVVDPHEKDIESYAAFAGSKRMAVTHVIDTHIHADHRSGGATLAKTTGAHYCLHESAQVQMPFEPLRDQQSIDFGNTRIQVLHTPGHTP